MDLPENNMGEQSLSGSLCSLKEDQKRTLALYNTNMCFNVVDFYYVSDLHLDYRLWRLYPDGMGKDLMESYVASAVDQILPPYNGEENDSDRPIKNGGLVLICGDVAMKTDVLTTFLKMISDRIQEYGGNLVFVMGNHERRHLDSDCPTVQLPIGKIIEDYRQFCQTHDIIFLHNELLLFDGKYNLILDTSSILNSSPLQLVDVCSNAEALIFGGTAFQKRDEYYGLIKDAVFSNEILHEYSSEADTFTKTYKKLTEVFRNDNRVVITTHYPPGAWIDEPVCPEWVYFHGHTHQNTLLFNDEMKIFGDNQWGRKNSKKGLKHYCRGFLTDIFSYLGDGVYKITREQYLLFHRHLAIPCEMNRDVSIIMLKREGFYLFLHEADKKRLKLLEGGRSHPLENETIAHVYDNMVYMAQKLLKGTIDIRNHMKVVSEYIRSFGGNGTIHGCIVDIDFWNHIYVNPFDGSITPYFALDMVNKIVYPDVRSLLISRIPALVGAYDRSMELQKSIVRCNSLIKADPCGTPYKETDIYAASNRMKNIQYLADRRIVRRWIPDEFTRRNQQDSEPVKINDLSLNGTDFLKPRKPFVLTSGSLACKNRVKNQLLKDLRKGPLTESNIKQAIRDCCAGMEAYEMEEIDYVIDKLFSIILPSMKSSGHLLSQSAELPIVNNLNSSYINSDWKQVYYSLMCIELDFADVLLEYLLSEQGAALRSELQIDFSGKHDKDLKKIYRELFVGNRRTILKEKDHEIWFTRPTREDIKELIELYLQGNLVVNLPTLEKIEHSEGYYPDIYAEYGFNVITAFYRLTKVSLLYEIDWLADALKLLCARILCKSYNDPQKIEYIENYLYSPHSNFDEKYDMFNDFSSDDRALPSFWIKLLDNENVIKYLVDNAIVYQLSKNTS